jgi:hypothetical protein
MMWWDVAIDVLAPTRAPKSVERSVDRLMEKAAPGGLRVECTLPGELVRRLNESGWLADEVIAAGVLEQGKPPSLLAATTGVALVQLARARRSKSLPREFVLAVTADRVVAFATSPWKEGDPSTDSVAAMTIKPGERGAWPRGSVRLTDPYKRLRTQGATLQLPGEEPLAVICDGDRGTAELVELLSEGGRG